MSISTSTPPAPVSSRPDLARPVKGRVLAGVCSGLSTHLGVPVRWVRVAAIASVFGFGFGLAAYVSLWATVPVERSGAEPARREAPPEPAAPAVGEPRKARRLRTGPDLAGSRHLLILGFLAAGIVGLSTISTTGSSALRWGIAAVIMLCGAALAWSQIDQAREGEGLKTTWFAILAGWGFACLALVTAVGHNRSMLDVFWALAAGLILLAATAFVLLPAGLWLWRSLGSERSEQAREAERADIAAHLHDSVLQTLALIRSRSHDAAAVVALARSQERELRQWLYTDRAASAESVATQLIELAGQVEDTYGAQIDTVTVGDAAPTTASHALLAATREALINSVRHSGAEVSLFAELTPTCQEVFVRDRGVGFDLGQVPGDRHGVRDSIFGRMARHGGRADIRTSPGNGTEVHLRINPAPQEEDPT